LSKTTLLVFLAKINKKRRKNKFWRGFVQVLYHIIFGYCFNSQKKLLEVQYFVPNLRPYSNTLILQNIKVLIINTLTAVAPFSIIHLFSLISVDSCYRNNQQRVIIYESSSF
jgi:hypothetical protein